MPIALVVVALAAVAFLVLYLMARSSAAQYQEQAEARYAALEDERDEVRATLEAQLDARARELADSRTLAEARASTIEEGKERIAKLEAQSSQLSTLVRRLSTERDELSRAKEEQAAELGAQLESRAAEIATLTGAKAALEAELAQARAEVAAAEARNTGIVIGGDGVDPDAPHPESLWALELARSERTWRTSVATNPFASPTPFETTDDPVRLAVEVEAAALRENVGAGITISWEAQPVAEPSRRHLIVRVAQELLEAAARNPEPLRLVVAGGGDAPVTLRLEPLEAGDRPINLTPPDYPPDTVDIDVDDDRHGLTVTVRAV